MYRKHTRELQAKERGRTEGVKQWNKDTGIWIFSARMDHQSSWESKGKDKNRTK